MITVQEMEPGIHYIVIVGNVIFEKGDHIHKDETGYLLCREAGGWLDQEEQIESFEGVGVSIDIEFYEDKQRKLEKSLEQIGAILKKHKHIVIKGGFQYE